MSDFLDLLDGWDGVGVVVRRDQPTGTWIFVAIHDDTLGPATGGCRMKVYDRPEDGLADALRLAEGMTHKWAAMDFPFGGGKTVLAIPRPLQGEERRGLLHRFGELLNSLGGSYGTGADLGTTTEDMLTIAEVSEYVIGVHGRTEGPMDPSPFTAIGVFEGVRAAVRHRFGSDDLHGRKVLIEGVGAVGASLAGLIADAGGEMIVTDIDRAAAEDVAARVGGCVVDGEDAYAMVCDVLAPCAVGATLNARSIPGIGAAIVAGAANNQLAEPEDADRLHERGILYAPDYVINGGGAMAFTSLYLGADVDEAEGRVRGIGARLEQMFEEAAAGDVSPVVAARAHADRILGRGPRSGVS